MTEGPWPKRAWYLSASITGQSAGSFAVNYLTVSPLAKGLFHRAFGEGLGAASMAELRSLPADSILNARGGMNGPFTDGYVIPESVMDAYENGQQNDVPVIAGRNGDDRVMPRTRPADKFREQAKTRFGDLAEEFLAVYPAGTEEEATRSQYAMSRDETFGIQAYTWALTQFASGKSPVFLYNFNRSLPAHSPETQFGAFHSGEIVYAYDNLHTLDQLKFWEAYFLKL